MQNKFTPTKIELNFSEEQLHFVHESWMEHFKTKQFTIEQIVFERLKGYLDYSIYGKNILPKEINVTPKLEKETLKRIDDFLAFSESNNEIQNKSFIFFGVGRIEYYVLYDLLVDEKYKGYNVRLAKDFPLNHLTLKRIV